MEDSRSEILGYFTNRIQAAKEQQLKELDLSVPSDTHVNDRLEHIPDEVFKLTQLESLNLSGNRIKTIPESLTKLTNLTSLDLSSNGIKTVPEFLTKLINLTSLDLSSNGIKTVPEFLTKLSNLTLLNLSGNIIENIPKSLTKVTNLTSLNLSENGIKTIPDFLTKVTNLTHLNLSENGIKTIPEPITKLTNLTRFNLSRNGIKTIPESITKLTNLTSLCLNLNGIKTIPEPITKLTNLASLYLSLNGIETIPESITKLTNLTSLYLSLNRIRTIPESITKSTNLTTLDLNGNRIKTIPESLSKITNLTSLNLSGNGIKTISESITKLNNLTSLYLSRNGIKNIPESLSKLTNLTSLNLSENGIKIIPEFLSKLTNLTSLNLSENGIETIPEFLSKLTNLTSLNLSENGIETIPEFLSKLTNLTSLNLSSNGIETIPESLSKLTNLTSLDLSDNEIKNIPESLSKLTNLTSLNLSGSKIETIPESLTKITNLIVLKLDKNPIETPPIEIVDRGIKSIRDYFLQLEAGRDYIYEAKLIIVGEGGAGKTTLAKKIENAEYELQSDEKSTEGIDVINWKFNMPEKDREFQVNIWDFGGQEIYHATHQFFLTKRSLYTLVADTRKEDTDFYYWLNVVELLTDNSPVLIIKNEKQDRQREININALRGQFSNLKETLATNLKTNRGLPEIVTNIQDYIKKLPHIGQVLPKTWVQVREALEKDPRNYIPLAEYLTICDANGFTKHSDKLQLSGYLHDLGVCLHFQDKEDSILYKTVILKPKWGTDAVYKVLDSKQVNNNQGCFSRNDLKAIWYEEKYAPMRGELLELMSKFQLCYEIPSCPDTFISPQLLSDNQPEYNWNKSNNLILRYSYPNFMPKGIISRFIVVMHQYIEQQDYVWKSGVRLIQDDTKAEVIEDYGKREIRIRVVGHNKRNFMTIITHELDKINDSFNKRLKYLKLIPCNCKLCQPSQDPYTYEFNKLLERVANNKLTIECGNPPYNEVQVLSLIDNAIDIRQLVPQDKLARDKSSYNFNGDIKQLVIQLLEKGDVLGGIKTGDRNINQDQGNYNENIAGDSIQGDKSDHSRNLKVDNVGGDFNPTNSPIMSDNSNNTPTNTEKVKKKPKWGIIISVVAIVITACVSGLFNQEIREFFNLNTPSETPEELEGIPAN